MRNFWNVFTDNSPQLVKEAVPAPPRLGEHCTKCSSLSTGDILITYFDPASHKPLYWRTVVHPLGLDIQT